MNLFPHLLLSLHLLASLNTQAQEYSFEKMSPATFKQRKIVESDALVRDLYCHAEEHLEDYSQFIASQVIPRLRREIPLTTQTQVDSFGNFLQLSDNLSTGDLFHAHLRVPVNPLSKPHGKIDAVFTDPSLFHIQYHSFESQGLFISDWIKEIEKISNPALENWLRDIEEHKRMEKQRDASSSYASYEPVQSTLAPLTEEQLQIFAQDWFEVKFQRRVQNSNEDQWQISRLIDKLKMIDPKDVIGGSSKILANRSFITENNTFKILPQLNISGFLQIANVYFSPIGQIPGFKAFLSSAQEENISLLYNLESPDFPRENFKNNLNETAHKRLYNDLLQSIQQVGDPNFMFYDKLNNNYDKDKFLVFMWDDKYLYSIWYSLLCH